MLCDAVTVSALETDARLACASNMSHKHACRLEDSEGSRYWALVWGGILTFFFSLIPSFRHFRIFNIIGEPLHPGCPYRDSPAQDAEAASKIGRREDVVLVHTSSLLPGRLALLFARSKAQEWSVCSII